MQISLRWKHLLCACLLSGDGCETGYILTRENALYINTVPRSEYEQIKTEALREEPLEKASQNGAVNSQLVPVTVKVHKLDLQHGTWLDARRFRATAKRPYDAIVPGILMISLGAALAVAGGINQADDSCAVGNNCAIRDLKTSLLGGFGGAFLGSGLVLNIIGIIQWSPEVDNK